MPTLISSPTIIEAAGYPPKQIEEYFGRVTTATTAVSIARMTSPPGWEEPGQQPEFDEYTVVLRGALRVEHAGGTVAVRAGQAMLVRAGEWVRYSSPGFEGAEYVSVCIPAFSAEGARRGE